MINDNTEKEFDFEDEDPSKIIVIDTETTGVDRETDEIVQISIIDGYGNELMNEYISPDHKKEWPGASAVNGIYPEDVKDCPHFSEVADQVQEIFNQAKTIVAYNASFDLSILHRYGISWHNCNIEDVMLDFAPVYGQWDAYRESYKWQKLTDCAAYFDYSYKAHDSLEDCRATLHCFKCLKELERSKDNGKEQEHLLMDGNTLRSIIPDDVRSICFTDESAPFDARITDVSMYTDGSVASWRIGDEFFISSQKKGEPIKAAKDCSNMFTMLGKVKSIDLSNLDTRFVKNMGGMFYDCHSLKELDLLRFDTRNAVTMSFMFSGCSRLKELDLFTFDTNQVTSMQDMFSDCYSLESIDFSILDTRNVQSMAWMFRGCESLQNVDMTGVSTRYVKDMSFMFHECESLKKLDLSSFSFKNVQDVCFMFSGCSELEELDLNITDLNENECEMNGVLEGCTSLKPTEQTEMLLLQEAEHTDFVLMSGEKFNKVIPDDVKKIVFTDIFVPSNTQVIDVSEKQDGTVKAWITGEEMIVTSRMKNAPVRASWDCMEMFLNKDQLIAVDLSNLDTSNTITMEAMFYGCQSLKEISLQGMDTSSVMNMREMFTDCSSLEKVSAPSLDVSRVLYMTYMFSGCEKLKSLDLTGWKVPEQCVRAGMFEECSSLQKVPVFEKAENRNKSELSVTKGNDAIIKPNYERNSEQINLKDVKLNQEDKVMEL